jgi:hypothetical protein
MLNFEEPKSAGYMVLPRAEYDAMMEELNMYRKQLVKLEHRAFDDTINLDFDRDITRKLALDALHRMYSEEELSKYIIKDDFIVFGTSIASPRHVEPGEPGESDEHDAAANDEEAL